MINLTQKFSFETDSKTSFRKILNTILPIVFHWGGDQGFYVSSTPSDCCWNDGKDYRQSDQPLCMEYNGRFLLLEPASTYGGATFLQEIGQASSKDELAQMSCAKYEEPKPTRLFICEISRHASKNSQHYKSVHGIEMKTMALIDDKQVTLNMLFQAGIEEPAWFDGSLGVGYRLHLAGDGKLIISATLMYYGK
jgi:hypothetical protein